MVKFILKTYKLITKSKQYRFYKININPQDVLNAPRWQWMKDKNIDIETTAGKAIAEQLSFVGHKININTIDLSFGRGQIILRDNEGVYTGTTEPRTDCYVAVW